MLSISNSHNNRQKNTSGFSYSFFVFESFKMVKVLLNDIVLAESDSTKIVEGNHYFPPSSLNMEYFEDVPNYSTACPWKGKATYYTLKVDGKTMPKAAWTYKQPMKAATEVQDHVAFFQRDGVKIVE
ncbi:hypothetical protein ACA910_022138 [Epithemia clementina (nom. ined.)]